MCGGSNEAYNDVGRIQDSSSLGERSQKFEKAEVLKTSKRQTRRRGRIASVDFTKISPSSATILQTMNPVCLCTAVLQDSMHLRCIWG